MTESAQTAAVDALIEAGVGGYLSKSQMTEFAAIVLRSSHFEHERLRMALRNVRAYIKDCDHEPALDEIDTALARAQDD